MYQHDPQVAGPHEPGVFHIVHLPLPGELPPDDTGVAGDEGDAQRQNDVVGAEAQQGDEHQRQQDTGKGGDSVVDPHQQLVHQPAEITGQGAHQRSHHGADGHGAGADEEGGAGAHHDPAENIPAEIVRTEQVPQGGRSEFLAAGHGRGGIGRPEAAHQRHGRDDRRDGKADAEIVILFLVQQQEARPPFHKNFSLQMCAAQSVSRRRGSSR